MKLEKFSQVVPVPHEVFDHRDDPVVAAMIAAIAPPTAKEMAERDRRLAEKRAARLAAQARLREALAQLDALTGLEREILDLHSFSKGSRWPYCNGSREDEWPCSTVLLIAERNGIDLGEDFHELYDPEWSPDA